MSRTLNLLGHPVHLMLVVFPAGLLFTSVLVDVAVLAGVATGVGELARGLLGLGLLGGLVAAPFGWLDWRRIPRGTRAHRVGAWHGGGNVVALLVFALSWYMREPGQPAPTVAWGLSLLAGAILFGTAWLGGELVTQLGVGVRVGAHLDAPSSLPSTHTAPTPMDNPTAELLSSVAGEEDPGAAVDSPAPSPAQPARPLQG
ncbi:DUF2231 domain-containing protein [Hydrogenophaga sp. A37]|uniref:DUF2231 domain-containing protein n=1 Tax=Hydrogenophaga sp. A37 TaxID=1945864 RepID=UPI0009D4E8D3|nr:DUF2231 domain-containing protein [Hydrogenophaga sp. A37]OOG86668.1 hypothetical protein B0E41_05440 [Hydrogenophaga sp. A37]